MVNYGHITGTIQGHGLVTGKLQGHGLVDGTISFLSGVRDFRGPYEYTPSSETQVIPILSARATENITINPIPNNYGLIEWDGSVLTVS